MAVGASRRMAMGMDLSQLVAGRVAGRTVGDLAVVAEVDRVVVDAFCAGVEAGGGKVDRDQVELVHLVGLVVRSALPCLGIRHAADLPEEQKVALLAQRTGLARLALDRLAAVSRR